MRLFIAQSIPKLIKNLILNLGVLGLLSCHSTPSSPLPPTLKNLGQKEIKLPSGKTLTTYLAISDEEQQQGLSGLKLADFPQDATMLFIFPETGPRRFWMKDTYFNLDILFLDSDYKILARDNDMPAYPGDKEPQFIPRTRTVEATYVLEIRADSPWSKELKVGEKVKIK